MELRTGAPEDYLGADDVVQTDAPAVVGLATRLHAESSDAVAFARSAFEWVRDEVAHSVDAGDPRVTVTATDVLEHRVGLCFAKSHLLVAVLRAGGVPAGLCYQRFADRDGAVLHGLVAVHVGGTWHRQDPRGNKPGVDAQFSLAAERLAWVAEPACGDLDYPDVLVAPAPVVLSALRGAGDALVLCAVGLPGAL